MCNNTMGSYNCSCNSGYEGNGFNCTGMCLVQYSFNIMPYLDRPVVACCNTHATLHVLFSPKTSASVIPTRTINFPLPFFQSCAVLTSSNVVVYLDEIVK